MDAAERTARDELIRRLQSEGRSARTIAAAVGCSPDTAWEIGWDRREERNRRRREHAREVARSR